ncbi:MAG TPA: hypothetical protein PKY96_16030 [Flavobacteriales bacterium]|nr:hypothetical protein [Flavobacteriales bacterium]
MSEIHYFQRYSQPENVITNNTLLLLQRLYQYRPRLLQDTLAALFDDTQTTLSVGVSMNQQVQVGEHGIPDGALAQDSFRLLIETKLSKGFGAAQLDRHIKAFRDEKTKVLLLLSPSSLDQSEVDKLTKKAASENGVTVLSKTFEDLLAAIANALSERDYEMQDMLADYRKFCSDEGILPVWQFWMRAITAGWTIEQNNRYGLYYDLSSRGYSEHAYLGLYKQKAVRSIGKIVRVVCADLVNDELQVLSVDFGGSATDDELERIRKVMIEAETDPGYKIKEGHRFFLVDEFFDTVFEKATPRPIMRTKFFDLRDYLPEKFHKTLPPPSEIAALLNGKTWDQNDQGG